MADFKKWGSGRDLLRLFGLCLLVLAPVIIVARLHNGDASAGRSVSNSIKTNLWPDSSMVTVALSPDGTKLASLVPGNLVVWDADTQKELARFPVNSEANRRLQWSGNDIITNSGSYAQSWDLINRKASSVPVDTEGSNHSSDIKVQETHIDPLSDLKTHTQYDGTFGFFRASTGQALPFKTPANLKPADFKLDEMSGSNWLVLRAATKGPTVLICAMPEKLPVSKQPTPTPASPPTSMPSAEMRKWQDKRTELLDELADLRNDLPESINLPAAERKQRTQRAMALQARIVNEEARFQALSLTPTTSTKAYYGQIFCWDARTGKVLWQQRLPVDVFMPVLMVSPDAKVVAVLGTLRASKDTPPSNDFSGVDFLDSATGRILSRASLNEELVREKDALWLPGPVLCVPDRDESGASTLSFLDARNGHKRNSWPLQALAFDPSKPYPDAPSAWSCDASGTQWVFATPSEGWRKLTTAQIEASVHRYKTRKSSTKRE